MRYKEFSTKLDEKAPNAGLNQPTSLNVVQVRDALQRIGFPNIKTDGNKLHVLIQVPAGQNKTQYRKYILNALLAKLKKFQPQYSEDSSLSSIGGIIFPNSLVSIVVKEVEKQGEKSSGIANEATLHKLLTEIIRKYGSVNVQFIDNNGRKLSMANATNVELVGKDVSGGKKADAIIVSKEGRLPISLKQLDADTWESADTSFGQKAKQIIEKLIQEGLIELKVIGNRYNRKTKQTSPVYKLSKEIVVEPTKEEAMNAIFGTDLSPLGGIVIQTFKKEHFIRNGKDVVVQAHAVITNEKDIPESHMMVWLIRNDKTRSNPIPGLRTLGATLIRGIGRKGTKDVILVDVNGNVVQNPNIKNTNIPT